ncbi:MAG: hypothetical protein ABIM40_14305 [Pseudomonadota bacterium]
MKLRLTVFYTVIPAKAGIQEKKRALLEFRNSHTGNDLLHQTGQGGSLLSSLDSGLRRNDGFRHGFPFPEFIDEPFLCGRSHEVLPPIAIELFGKQPLTAC